MGYSFIFYTEVFIRDSVKRVFFLHHDLLSWTLFWMLKEELARRLHRIACRNLELKSPQKSLVEAKMWKQIKGKKLKKRKHKRFNLLCYLT